MKPVADLAWCCVEVEAKPRAHALADMALELRVEAPDAATSTAPPAHATWPTCINAWANKCRSGPRAASCSGRAGRLTSIRADGCWQEAMACGRAGSTGTIRLERRALQNSAIESLRRYWSTTGACGHGLAREFDAAALGASAADFDRRFGQQLQDGDIGLARRPSFQALSRMMISSSSSMASVKRWPARWCWASQAGRRSRAVWRQWPLAAQRVGAAGAGGRSARRPRPPGVATGG